jgi:large subunit ribosomal protein L18
MATKRPRTVLYRRKREGRTNYNKRLKLLLAKKPRVVVRFTNKKIIAQIVEFHDKGDKVLVAIDSSALKKQGWNYSLRNLPASYLMGMLLGKMALGKSCQEAVLDVGLRPLLKKSILAAFLKGVLDAGMNVPASDDSSVFPSEERISGKHIKDYALKLKENKEVYDKIFAGYLKKNLTIEDITENFTKTKEKIMS